MKTSSIFLFMRDNLELTAKMNIKEIDCQTSALTSAPSAGLVNSVVP